MKNNKIKPEDFLQIQELSDFENETLKGGRVLTKDQGFNRSAIRKRLNNN